AALGLLTEEGSRRRERVQVREARSETTGVRSTAVSVVRSCGFAYLGDLIPDLFLVRRLLACLLIVGEHRSAIAVGHLSDFDYFGGEGLPLVEVRAGRDHEPSANDLRLRSPT